MNQFFKKLFDSRDHTVEAHIVLLCLGVVCLVILTGYHVIVLHNAFDPNAYGEGLGWLLGGGGAAAWGQGLQRKSEGKNYGEEE